MRRLKRFLPVAICVILLGILASYAPWDEVAQALTELGERTYELLIALSLLYYGLKAVRFWLMLRALGIYQPLGLTALSYISAQPVSLLPAGEIYRCRALERETGVPMKRSLPTFTMQGLLEAGAMATVGLVSVLVVGKLRLVILAITLAVAAAFVAISYGAITPVLGLLNRLPLVNLNPERLEEFSRGHQTMLRSRAFPGIVGLSILIEVIGAAVAYVTIIGLGGQLNPFQAVLTYIIPLLVGFISLIPGGLGVSEQSTIAILLLADNSLTTAVAGTLLIRVTIVGSGLIYGLLAQLIINWRHHQPLPISAKGPKPL